MIILGISWISMHLIVANHCESLNLTFFMCTDAYKYIYESNVGQPLVLEKKLKRKWNEKLIRLQWKLCTVIARHVKLFVEHLVQMGGMRNKTVAKPSENSLFRYSCGITCWEQKSHKLQCETVYIYICINGETAANRNNIGIWQNELSTDIGLWQFLAAFYCIDDDYCFSVFQSFVSVQTTTNSNQ